MRTLRRVVSGGQTGVDRGALNAAIQAGLEHGGWCPCGRIAEDGTVPSKYQLTETSSSEYPQRTEQNVVDSDGTLILCSGKLSGGTQLTYRLARKHDKPVLVVDLHDRRGLREASDWMRRHAIQVLNVAGPRESSLPGIERLAEEFVQRLIARLGTAR